MKRFIILIGVVCSLLSFSCRNLILGPDGTKNALPVQHTSHFAMLLDSMRYTLDLPALAAAIMTDTGIVHAEAVGCRRYGGAVNVTNNDLFLLGSCGKSFTAVLIGLLVDEGKISWTTTLPEIFPEYSNTMRQEYRNVNLMDILSHSAGFVRDPDLILHSNSPRELRTEVVEWALAQPPAVKRGQYLYSNLGFIIAGAIAEKLAGKPYEELLIEKVTQPLGLITAGFGQVGSPGSEDQPLQHTPGHAPILPAPEDPLKIIQNPAGEGLYMSIGDWALFCKWVLACETGHVTLLKSETAKKMTTMFVSLGNGQGESLAWGISNQDWAGGKVLSFAGSNGYNYALVLLAPNRRFGVIAMSNQGAGTINSPLNPVLGRLINFYQYGD